ncbi:hypothetical protein C7974DRAFT_90573 [Boeremia exigua]|uniref:uncharacterized protein n=1 Tax=Boeremia exigua TaxID=749465 RepID=UPI001E8D58AB|nr:uncharacterized protein C7974DRAFT_90573 [Boeremia exigua]KAH6612057.1 hypothetical protein C7974DRAFT_90573 [Boeremia exigua]
MCDATFTFGQRGSHFFQCPSQRDTTRLPRKLTTLLSSPQIQQVHHVALGYEDSFLITWRDKDNQDRINTVGLPAELITFLYARNDNGRPARNIPAIRCTLGPQNTSFFAHDSAAYLWMNLPPDLLSALQSRIQNGSWTDRPRLVALGADATFVLITAQHRVIWTLDPYPLLSTHLETLRAARRIPDLTNITLHAYRYGCFVAQSRDGTLRAENLPPHQQSGLKTMADAVARDSLRAGRSVPRREIDPPVVPRPSPLQERARVRREWNDHTQRFTAQSKGLKLSVSFSIGGLARVLG